MTDVLDTGRWARVKNLFEEALARPASERDAFLAAACGDDREVLGEVRTLLAADADGGLALDDGFRGAVNELAVAIEDGAAHPTRIGRYRIVSEIGHGGMGSVFLAERDDDFHQRVAIKVVRGVLGEHGLRRFRAERQILASLSHPCIAQLIDGGTTAEGLPYLVMEYVDGVALNTYCDAHTLTIAQRLDLLCRIADAVSHAHRSLVVHRDLKPSNILVTADGTPKLLDFGIAKLLDAGDDTAMATAPSMQLLTPEYASPEQVLNAPITTSTDIYSLGVILYELVASRRPYRLISKLREELEHVVCRQDPPPPGIAADLDTIVLHAMEKDPTRRYASVEHLVEDIRRYLEGRPIEARPSTWRYRSARFVQRHRVGVATAAVFAAVVIGFAVALGFAAARAARERNTSERVTALLVELFSGSGQSAQGEKITASELLDQGTQRVRRELADRPDLQARVLDSIGAIYIGLGLPERAQSVLQDSATARSSAGALDSLDRARTLFLLAEALRGRRQFAAAAPLAREAVAMGRRVLGRKTPQVAQWGNTLGLIEHELGQRAEAEALFLEDTQIFRDTLGPEHPMVATSLLNTSMSLRARGDFAGAEARAREALAIYRYTFGSATADSLHELAAGVEGQGRLHDAEQLLREEVAIRRQTYGAAGHPSLAAAMRQLAGVLHAEGQIAEAADIERDAAGAASNR